MEPSLHIIYASTSGNTEHAIETLIQFLRLQRPGIALTVTRAERAEPKDLLFGDVIILASGTWNTGGREGQLNPHMDALLHSRAAEIDLGGKPMTFLSLGDDRYYFRTRCTEHFLRFMREHGGRLLVPPLCIVNEPYGQEDKVLRWAEKIVQHLQSFPAPIPPSVP